MKFPQASIWVPNGRPRRARDSGLLAGLQAYWDFDGSGTTYAADDPTYFGYDSKSFYDLSVHQTTPTSDASGKQGRCVKPSVGNNSGLRYDTPDFQQTGSFTLSLWYKCAAGNASASHPFLAAPIAGVTYDYEVVCINADIYFIVYGAAGANRTAASTSSATFSHFLCQFDASTGIASISKDNGTPTSTTALGEPLRQTSQRIYVGHANPGVDEATDEVAVFRRLLTAPEKTQLAAGTAPGSFYPFS